MGKREKARKKKQAKLNVQKLKRSGIGPHSHAKNKNSKNPSKGGKPETPRGRCTRYDQKPLPSVLVVGDGDFSFSLGLLGHRGGSPNGLVLTGYDSREEVLAKYPASAPGCLNALATAGVTVCHGVDATQIIPSLGKSGYSHTSRWDRIVWNFPHTGHQRTHMNRAILRTFLEKTSALLNPSGQVHITLKLKPPYDRWDLTGQVAEGTGMVVGDKLFFDTTLFPGYRHRTTQADAKKLHKGRNQNNPRDCRTFVFIRDPAIPQQALLSTTEALVQHPMKPVANSEGILKIGSNDRPLNDSGIPTKSSMPQKRKRKNRKIKKELVQIKSKQSESGVSGV